MGRNGKGRDGMGRDGLHLFINLPKERVFFMIEISRSLKIIKKNLKNDWLFVGSFFLFQNFGFYWAIIYWIL